ncbi:MAG: pyrimidine-nucleoside phosphorylase [Lachnospiraceae bacterium]|nr:pyrimidine-nucleoside phosphorylase [Lachnospiraceae bacterium]
MRMYDLLEKKKHGGALSGEEIRFMIDGYTKGTIPDYQMSAMTMAIYFQGMTDQETGDLTLAMRDSGAALDLSGIKGIKVDKHSTGGVGDKVSLALAPLVSSVGVKVAKMSGRGLGHTGGTIDKLESIPGFSTELTMEQFIRQVDGIGMAIMGQTAELAPADKKLYALRDVTATVDQLSLIASSVMSKKLAAGADAIVLDVKCGSGAFMRDFDGAQALAKEMVKIGKHAGRKTWAYITDMDQPLGYAVGNAIEVIEALDTLRGGGPADFRKLILTLGARMTVLGGVAADFDSACALLEKQLDSGKALQQMARFVQAQGGDPSYVLEEGKLKPAANTLAVKADRNGYIGAIDCAEVGMASLLLGGGREKKEDVIDTAVGLRLHKKCTDAVQEGDVLAELYYNDGQKAAEARARLQAAFHITEKAPEAHHIILGEVEG